MFLILSALFIILGLIGLIDFVSLLVDEKISTATTVFWKFIGFGVWSPVVFIFISYMSSDISMDDHGLQTTFLFKKLTVKWEDIDQVYKSKPFGLRIGERSHIIVARNGLTFFHRIYGLIYGQINQPSLLIWSSIDNYDALINKIKKGRKKR